MTGAAGFIGYHTAKQILENGDSVIAIDNINDFYDTKLKMKRIHSLEKYNDFSLENIDLTSKSNVLNLNKKVSNINGSKLFISPINNLCSYTHNWISKAQITFNRLYKPDDK